MEKLIEISGKAVGFKATALTPRLYRHKMQRDMIQDMAHLRKALNKVNKLPKDATEEQREDAQLSVMDLEIFENVAFVMAKQYDPTIKDDVGEWLDSFDMFSIYVILPQLLELWAMNEKTTAIPKKK